MRHLGCGSDHRRPQRPRPPSLARRADRCISTSMPPSRRGSPAGSSRSTCRRRGCLIRRRSRTRCRSPDPIPHEEAARIAEELFAALCDLPVDARRRRPPTSATGRVTAIVHLEGAEPIAPDLSNLEWWYERGLRSIGLVWSRPNAVRRRRAVPVSVVARHRRRADRRRARARARLQPPRHPRRPLAPERGRVLGRRSAVGRAARRDPLERPRALRRVAQPRRRAARRDLATPAASSASTSPSRSCAKTGTQRPRHADHRDRAARRLPRRTDGRSTTSRSARTSTAPSCPTSSAAPPGLPKLVDALRECRLRRRGGGEDHARELAARRSTRYVEALMALIAAPRRSRAPASSSQRAVLVEDLAGREDRAAARVRRRRLHVGHRRRGRSARRRAAPAPSSAAPRRPGEPIDAESSRIAAHEHAHEERRRVPAARDQARRTGRPPPRPGRRGTAAGRSAARTRRSRRSRHVDRAELGDVADARSPPSSASSPEPIDSVRHAHARARPARGLRRRPRLQQLRPADRRGGDAGRASTPRSTPASRSSTPPTSTATRGGSETIIGHVLKDRRDQVVLATKFGKRRWATAPTRRGSRDYIRARARGVAAAAADRRDRPLPAPPGGSRDAARGDVRRARRARRRGQDPRLRHVELRARDARAAPRPIAGTGYVSEQSEYSWLERGAEAELLPTCQRARPRLHPVLPARVGAAHRQGVAPTHRRRRARASTAARSTQDRPRPGRAAARLGRRARRHAARRRRSAAWRRSSRSLP